MLVGNPEGKRPRGKPRSKFDDSIKIELIKIRLGFMYWID
jgi:hypothetical protein